MRERQGERQRGAVRERQRGAERETGTETERSSERETERSCRRERLYRQTDSPEDPTPNLKTLLLTGEV